MAKANYGKAKERTQKTASVQRVDEAKARKDWPTTAARIKPELYEMCKKISLRRQAEGHDETFTDIIRDAFAEYAKKHRDIL